MRKEKNPKFQALHKAREMAAQFVYSMENHPGRVPEDTLELLLSEDAALRAELEPEEKAEYWGDEPAISLTGEALDYCRSLALGAWRARNDADDALLSAENRGWRPDRMAAVDRAILRVAVFEGFLPGGTGAPVRLAISEAVKTAGAFGGEKSAKFVNGVLANLARAMFPQETGGRR